MSATTASNVFIPQIYHETVAGAFASKAAFMGSLAASLGIVVTKDSFPLAGKDAIGQTVNIPYFSSIGEFQDNVSDGTPLTSVQMSQAAEQGTVVRGTLGVEVSRWANSGGPGEGGKDIYQEAADQTVASAVRYMDRKIIDAAVSGNNQLVIDKFSQTVPRNFDTDLILDGLGMLGDFGTLNEIAALAVHSKTMIDLLKLKDANGRNLVVQPTLENAPPMFFGKPLIVSDRLPVDSSGLTSVTSAGTTPPVITLSQTTNREGKIGPVRPINVVVACTTLGARGTWKFQVSIDGGATYTAADYYTSGATVALIDPLDPAGGLLGVTLNIATGTAATDNTWTFQSIMKHTSLLLKKGALVFWFNKNAMLPSTIPVPFADTIQAASHMYCVAYRYKRLPGQPYPGVVKIRHNAGGL